MWPSVRHGDRVTVRLGSGGSAPRGTPVMVCDRGVPELLRVDAHDAILFTPDVYSFVPGERARTALLRKMRGWLRPGGVVFLSPRWVTRGYERWILTLSWIRRGVGRDRGWGASHTRYIGTDGELRRSFIHLFTFGRIRREAERAGFTVGPRRHGYVELA